jgi:pimeloyl-ACP methyl ester carboxylesterase
VRSPGGSNARATRCWCPPTRAEPVRRRRHLSAFIQQRTTGSVVLVGRADNVLPAAQQRVMAERAGARTVEVNAGHLSMLSRPGAVTDLITAAARRVQ